jgi:putative membrane protein
MTFKPLAAGAVFAALAALAACSTTAQAPPSSDLSAGDLNSVTAAYQLVQFDLAECDVLKNGGATPQTLAISAKICADATHYQVALQQLAVARHITLPNDLSYDLKSRVVVLSYHASPNINAQYLHDAIESHEDALAIFENEAATGTDPQIVSFDKGAVPVVQSNLESLRAARTAAN